MGGGLFSLLAIVHVDKKNCTKYTPTIIARPLKIELLWFYTFRNFFSSLQLLLEYTLTVTVL